MFIELINKNTIPKVRIEYEVICPLNFLKYIKITEKKNSNYLMY